MSCKRSIKKLYTVLLLSASIIFTAFAMIVFSVNISMAVRLLLLSFAFLFIVLGILSWCFFRRMVSGFTDDLSICLDDMINGEENVSFVFHEETLGSKLQVKLKRLYEIMQSHNKRSVEEKEAIQSLVSDISHQVKTPVANIKMYNGILQDRPISPEQQRDFLQAMAVQIDKLDFLMQSMVKMSRLETGIFAMQPKLLFIYTTIAQALSGVEPQAERKDIHISVQCQETLQVMHDQKWTAEALFNLLDNAVKYTPAGGQIKISVNRWEIYTKIDLADTGKGIPEKNHAAIFKRFYREPDVYHQDGAGIGLYLARKIITMQGGYIEVKSEQDQGAVFSVFIPN